MTIPYHRIASAFFNRPLLLTPQSADTIGNYLFSRIGAGGGAGGGENDSGESVQLFRGQQLADGTLEVHSPRSSRFYGNYPLDERGRPMPFRRTEDGTAIITLVGEMVNRGAWVGASSGLISYEGFKYQIGMAAADPKTRAIVLDMESPGGEAVGAFEAAAALREAAKAKEVIAVVNGMAASAMYAIASGASRIVTMPSGLVGSIGVVLVHFDYSEYLKDEGVKPTLIFAGKQKVDGNPFEPLPAAVRDRLQGEVQSFYDLFVSTVTAGRPLLSDKDVRDTEAGVFTGQDAVTAKLADEVGTFEEVLSELSIRGEGRSSSTKGKQMTDQNGQPAANQPGANQPTATDERGRIKSIIGSEAAKGRETLANHLAFETDMTPDAALAVLNAAPAAAAPAPAAPAARGSRLDALAATGQLPDPKVKEVSASAEADDVGAGLNAAVDRMCKSMGLQPLN